MKPYLRYEKHCSQKLYRFSLPPFHSHTLNFTAVHLGVRYDMCNLAGNKGKNKVLLQLLYIYTQTKVNFLWQPISSFWGFLP